jgi:hypothetical protein
LEDLGTGAQDDGLGEQRLDEESLDVFGDESSAACG